MPKDVFEQLFDTVVALQSKYYLKHLSTMAYTKYRLVNRAWFKNG